MDKTKLLYLADMLMALSFLSVGITGLMKWPGLGLAFSIRQLSTIHDWSGATLAAMVFIHLALHWNWIVCTTKNMFRKKKVECKLPQ